MNGNFRLGFAHYPEHYPEESWKRDFELMREAGADVVRIAEFAWSRMEPREGVFTFEWLDRYFDLATRYEIDIILCTPTAAPTPWVRQRYPDIVLMDEDGRRAGTGGRRYNCPTSPNYLRLSGAIIEQMARRYGAHERLLGWQTDNEFGGAVCFCEHCRDACREWLRRKYQTVEALNKALGLVFWSHEFSDWSEVDYPRRATKGMHPSARLDIHRFFSDQWARFASHQVEIIRRHSPKSWISHNLPSVGVNFDMFDMAAVHDFASIDMYPRPFDHPERMIALYNDVTSSLQKRPHWVLELSTGSPVTLFYKAPVPRPGQMPQWAHLCAAHGAEGVMFYSWRKRPYGSEMLSNGLLEHDGVPRRRYDDIKRLGEDFKKLREVLPSYEAPREVAILWDFSDRVNAEVNSYVLDVPFNPEMAKWMWAARRLGLNVRIARSTGDLTPYRLVFAPCQYTTSPEIAGNLSAYVRGGGTLVGMQRMGIFTINGNPLQAPMPGGMIDLFGAEIEEYERVMEPNPNRLLFADSILPPVTCRDWIFILKSHGAKALAAIERDFYAGKPGATINEFGKGRALFVGTMLDDMTARRFVEYAARLAGLKTLPLDLDEDIHIVRLIGPQGEPIRVVFNLAQEAKTVDLPEPGVDLINGGAPQSRLELPAMAVRWLSL